MSMHHVVQPKVYYIIFVALLVLVGATVGVAELPLGAFSIVGALFIATLKAALIMLYFMHVRWANPLIRLTAVAALFWLAILLTYTLTDYITRTVEPQFWWLG